MKEIKRKQKGLEVFLNSDFEITIKEIDEHDPFTLEGLVSIPLSLVPLLLEWVKETYDEAKAEEKEEESKEESKS